MSVITQLFVLLVVTCESLPGVGGDTYHLGNDVEILNRPFEISGSSCVGDEGVCIYAISPEYMVAVSFEKAAQSLLSVGLRCSAAGGGTETGWHTVVFGAEVVSETYWFSPDILGGCSVPDAEIFIKRQEDGGPVRIVILDIDLIDSTPYTEEPYTSSELLKRHIHNLSVERPGYFATKYTVANNIDNHTVIPMFSFRFPATAGMSCNRYASVYCCNNFIPPKLNIKEMDEYVTREGSHCVKYFGQFNGPLSTTTTVWFEDQAIDHPRVNGGEEGRGNESKRHKREKLDTLGSSSDETTGEEDGDGIWYIGLFIEEETYSVGEEPRVCESAKGVVLPFHKHELTGKSVFRTKVNETLQVFVDSSSVNVETFGVDGRPLASLIACTVPCEGSCDWEIADVLKSYFGTVANEKEIISGYGITNLGVSGYTPISYTLYERLGTELYCNDTGISPASMKQTEITDSSGSGFLSGVFMSLNHATGISGESSWISYETSQFRLLTFVSSAVRVGQLLVSLSYLSKDSPAAFQIVCGSGSFSCVGHKLIYGISTDKAMGEESLSTTYTTCDGDQHQERYTYCKPGSEDKTVDGIAIVDIPEFSTNRMSTVSLLVYSNGVILKPPVNIVATSTIIEEINQDKPYMHIVADVSTTYVSSYLGSGDISGFEFYKERNDVYACVSAVAIKPFYYSSRCDEETFDDSNPLMSTCKIPMTKCKEIKFGDSTDNVIQFKELGDNIKTGGVLTLSIAVNENTVIAEEVCVGFVDKDGRPLHPTLPDPAVKTKIVDSNPTSSKNTALIRLSFKSPSFDNFYTLVKDPTRVPEYQYDLYYTFYDDGGVDGASYIESGIIPTVCFVESETRIFSLIYSGEDTGLDQGGICNVGGECEIETSITKTALLLALVVKERWTGTSVLYDIERIESFESIPTSELVGIIALALVVILIASLLVVLIMKRRKMKKLSRQPQEDPDKEIKGLDLSSSFDGLDVYDSENSK